MEFLVWTVKGVFWGDRGLGWENCYAAAPG